MKASAEPAKLCCPPANEQTDLRPIEGAEADDELASLAKALGHPARVRILRILVIVKRWALEAGLDPMLFAGHSLRSGLATAAAKAGKSERSIMKQTGHRSVSVVRRYIRDAELFDDNAAAGIGL